MRRSPFCTMPETRDIFEQYRGAPVSSQCYKELGLKIQEYSQPEREALFESFQPKELHLQLLKLSVARSSGCHQPLLDGLKEECKFLSEFSLKSKLLFSGRSKELLDIHFLIPLLQTVSASTRNRILWNLGKHVSTRGNSKVSVPDMDTVYNAVSKVWGSNIALPLLCQTSKELLERELPNVTSLSNGQLLFIAKRFPFLALDFLEKHPCMRASRKAARYIVTKTIPKSFDYVVKQDSSFLTKTTMKIILRKYSNVVLESPSSWLNVLDKRIVKKVFKSEHFELFITKQMLELNHLNVPYVLLSYFEILSPSEVSTIIDKVFHEKYSCSLRSKLDFWEKNEVLLRMLDASDRSFVAIELSTKDPLSNRWLPLIATDISIPRIRKILSTEQDARARTQHISKLIETAMLNKDQSVIEDICSLVVSRYRNDKLTLQSFFNSNIDFLSLSTETFNLVLVAANRFYNPDDWQTHSAAKLFPVAIKRNWGESGLKEFLQNCMKGTRYFSISDLTKLENELRLICIDEVFTTVNIENKNVLRQLAQFLSLITKWSLTSSVPLITNNVKKCILMLLKSDIDRLAAIAFVCANLNSLNIQFVEDCFQYVVNPKLMAHLFYKKSSLVSTEETLKRVGKHIVEVGVHGFVKLLKKFRKLGYTDMLQYLTNESKEALADTQTDKLRKYTHAVVLLTLTSPADELFSTVDPFLPSTDNNTVDASKAGGDGSKAGRYCPLRASKREDAIYYGFGMSISHLGIPALAVERLRRFCVSGDLVLFVRDALYSVSSSLPNDKAKAFLLSLMKQPVSVKKHALRLLWRDVCNIESQEGLLLKLMESEEHLTMRIILINTTISSLNISNHSSMWQVLKQIINKLTPDDKAIVLEIINKRVPDLFLEEFYDILLEKCKILKDVENASIINSVLQCVSQVMSQMSEKFIESLITEFFLSGMFFGQTYSHLAMNQMVLGYLQGAPASALPGGRVEPRKNLAGRQQFLKERLDAAAIGGPSDVFDATQGLYPVRRLLMTFIQHFCSCCLVSSSTTSDEHQLTEYIDFFLSYFAQFNQNSIATLSIHLSLSKVLIMNASQSAFTLGQMIGEFCDSSLLKSSAALFCYFPSAVALFVNAHAIQTSHFTTSQESSQFANSRVLEIVRGLLETVPPSHGTENSPENLCSMLRLIIAARILPSHWLVADEYKDFRQTFLERIKNTSAEAFVFSDK